MNPGPPNAPPPMVYAPYPVVVGPSGAPPSLPGDGTRRSLRWIDGSLRLWFVLNLLASALSVLVLSGLSSPADHPFPIVMNLLYDGTLACGLLAAAAVPTALWIAGVVGLHRSVRSSGIQAPEDQVADVRRRSIGLMPMLPGTVVLAILWISAFQVALPWAARPIDTPLDFPVVLLLAGAAAGIATAAARAWTTRTVLRSVLPPGAEPLLRSGVLLEVCGQVISAAVVVTGELVQPGLIIPLAFCWFLGGAGGLLTAVGTRSFRLACRPLLAPVT